MLKTKLTLAAAAISIAFASTAFAKPIRHSQNDTAVGHRLYDSAVVQPSVGAQLQNPYYAPYIGQDESGSWFPDGGFH